mgnify:FL=1
MVLDLDRFKQINDSLDHQIGDELLQEVAERLRRACRQEDTIVRFGGDEFVIVLEDLQAESAAAGAAQHILDAFGEPFRLAEFELEVTASAGICVFPENTPSPQISPGERP